MSDKTLNEAENSLITYSVDDITSLTHLSRSLAYARIADRSLRAYKDGARTFVMHDDLMAYLRSRPIANPPPSDDEETASR